MMRFVAGWGIIVGSVVMAPMAAAHFQVLMPSTDAVSEKTGPDIDFEIVFTHPMDGGPVMDMGQPRQFGVMVRGEKTDLSSALKPADRGGKGAFTASYKVNRPGAHVFYIEPEPYLEAAEETYIQHFTKVIVDAYGSWSGWDDLVGFPVELKPLTRPYGVWAGNVFQAVVMKEGQPVPEAHVEVEYYNAEGDATAPTDAHVTQVLKSDSNGVFTFGIPWDGWWGFAALVDGDTKMKSPDGNEMDLEMGAALWVRAHPVTKGK